LRYGNGFHHEACPPYGGGTKNAKVTAGLRREPTDRAGSEATALKLRSPWDGGATVPPCPRPSPKGRGSYPPSRREGDRGRATFAPRGRGRPRYPFEGRGRLRHTSAPDPPPPRRHTRPPARPLRRPKPPAHPTLASIAISAIDTSRRQARPRLPDLAPPHSMPADAIKAHRRSRRGGGAT